MLGVALSWHRADHLLAEIDLFFDYDPSIFLAKTSSAWSSSASPFGPYGFPTYFAYYAALAFFKLLFGISWAQLIVTGGIFAIGALGTYVAALRLRFTAIGAISAAVIYTFSPFTQFLVTFVTGGMLFAVLPWAIVSVDALLSSPSPKAWLGYCSVLLVGRIASRQHPAAAFSSDPYCACVGVFSFSAPTIGRGCAGLLLRQSRSVCSFHYGGWFRYCLAC